MVEVVYGSEVLIPSFYDCLKRVARERIYIEMIEPPPLEKVIEFQSKLIQQKGPLFYAVKGNQVVGWCDIFASDNPRMCHRGGLGMGILPEYRSKGIGSLLLTKTLNKAKDFGLEKVELHVYTTNTNAIGLYKKHGFTEEGVIRDYRKLDGKYFDCLSMGKFLSI